jgi:hypothetical protein
MLVENNCRECSHWREALTWFWVPDAEKAKLRRRIARHKHEIRFLDQKEYERKMRALPVPASFLAMEPNLRLARA